MKKTLLSFAILFISLSAFSQTPNSGEKSMVQFIRSSCSYQSKFNFSINVKMVLSENPLMEEKRGKKIKLGTLSGITSFKAFSNTNFIGVNTNSEVVLSSDAGETWSVNILKDSLGNKIQSLTEIVILSETEAFVKTVATNPTTLYTNDNGATWSYYEYNQPKSLFQVNDTLIGFDHLPVPPFGFTKALGILRSTNKGVSYDTISFPPAGLLGNDFNNQFKKGYENISFINTQTFFINVNDRIFYKTADGGLTFTGIDYPGSNFVYDMFFISPTEGFVTVSGNAVQYTGDAGATWKKLQNDGEFLGPSVIKHLHKTNGQLFMMDYNNSYIIDQSTVVSTPQNIIPTAGLNTKTTLVNDSILLIPFENYFFKSINGGVTWNKTNQIISEFNSKVYYDSYTTRGKDTIFVNANTRIYLSTNGGDSFSLVHTTTRFNPQYTYFEHLKDDDFVLVGNGIIKYTLDGGTTWIEHNTGVNSPIATEVASLNAIYSLDFNKNILFSSDSGKTFSQVITNLVDKANAQKLFFINDSTGFVYGANSFIYKTENRGASWQKITDAIPLTRTYTWVEMEAKGENEIYLIGATGTGSGGKIFYSSDGGDTWSETLNNLRLSEPKLMTFKSGYEGLATQLSTIYRSGLYEATVVEIDVDKTITGTYAYSFDEESVFYYPNPCANELNIQSKSPVLKIDMVNSNGVVVMSGKEGTEKLLLEEFESGIYFLTIHTTENSQTVKVIKK